MQLLINKKILTLLLFTIIFPVQYVYSQEVSEQNDTLELKPYFGAFLGINLNFHDADFRSLPGVPSCCPKYTEGFGNGLYFGGVVDYPLNYKMQLTGRLSISKSNGELTRFEQTTVVVDGQETIGEFEHYVNSKFTIFGIEPLFTYKPITDLGLHGGFRLGLITAADYYQIEKISKPIDRGTFSDGRTYRNQSKGDIDSINSFQFGIKIGASYKLPINKKKTLFVVPEMFYTLNLTNHIQERNWSVNSLSFGVGIKYRIPPPPPPPPLPPMPPPDPEFKLQTKEPIFALDVDAIEIDSNLQEKKNFSINIEDFVSYNMRPLLNYVFFDENSAQIPERYVKLDKTFAAKFDENDLGNMNALETYYYLLNIVGRRMQRNSQSKISLIGTNANVAAEKNNLSLSEARAKSVADYLINIWGIETDRIKISARNLPQKFSKSDDSLGIQENRRVEIVSDDITITEPVFTLDTMRVLSTSAIKFIPKVLTEVGIKSWDFNLTQKDKQVFTQKGEGKLPDNWTWKLTKKNVPDGNGDLAYVLSALDSIGQKANSKVKRIPITTKSIDLKRRSGESDKEYEYYSLILFDYGKSELEFEHKKVVDFVKNRMSEDSKILIYGFTDSMGEEEINKKLSEKRAKEVLKRLGIDENLEIEGKGESQLLYDNSLPEGRLYCRTVTIDIETPIKIIDK